MVNSAFTFKYSQLIQMPFHWNPAMVLIIFFFFSQLEDIVKNIKQLVTFLWRNLVANICIFLGYEICRIIRWPTKIFFLCEFSFAAKSFVPTEVISLITVWWLKESIISLFFFRMSRQVEKALFSLKLHSCKLNLWFINRI